MSFSSLSLRQSLREQAACISRPLKGNHYLVRKSIYQNKAHTHLKCYNTKRVYYIMSTIGSTFSFFKLFRRCFSYLELYRHISKDLTGRHARVLLFRLHKTFTLAICQMMHKSSPHHQQVVKPTIKNDLNEIEIKIYITIIIQIFHLWNETKYIISFTRACK